MTISDGGVDVTTALINKITITETPQISFTLSPDAIQLTCGSSLPQTFIVNNVYNTPGTKVYNWDLGLPNNGWLYNGNPAPQYISTGNTNTISLTPVCGALQKNVSASVALNSDNYATNSTASTYTQPNMSIIGSSALCSGSSSYYIDNLPCNASVTWSSNPTGIISVPPNGSPVNISKLSNGSTTLTATINSCGKETIKYLIISTSYPEPATYLDIYGNGFSDPLHLCKNKTYNVEADFNTAYPQYEWLLPTGYTSTQSGGQNPFLTSTFYITIKSPSSGSGTGYLRVRAKNACGYGDPVFTNVAINCGGYGGKSYQVSPNPAQENLNVTINANENIKQTQQNPGIKKINIYNRANNLLKQQNFGGNSKQVQINVNDLLPGVYIIEIFDGKSIERQKIIIQR